MRAYPRAAGEAGSVSPSARSNARSLGPALRRPASRVEGGTGDLTESQPAVGPAELPGSEGRPAPSAGFPAPPALPEILRVPSQGIPPTRRRWQVRPALERPGPARAPAPRRGLLPTERRLRPLALGAVVNVARETGPEGGGARADRPARGQPFMFDGKIRGTPPVADAPRPSRRSRWRCSAEAGQNLRRDELHLILLVAVGDQDDPVDAGLEVPPELPDALVDAPVHGMVDRRFAPRGDIPLGLEPPAHRRLRFGARATDVDRELVRRGQ